MPKKIYFETIFLAGSDEAASQRGRHLLIGWTQFRAVPALLCYLDCLLSIGRILISFFSLLKRVFSNFLMNIFSRRVFTKLYARKSIPQPCKNSLPLPHSDSFSWYKKVKYMTYLNVIHLSGQLSILEWRMESIISIIAMLWFKW